MGAGDRRVDKGSRASGSGEEGELRQNGMLGL